MLGEDTKMARRMLRSTMMTRKWKTKKKHVATDCQHMML
jgi:hypothetical protein